MIPLRWKRLWSNKFASVSIHFMSADRGLNMINEMIEKRLNYKFFPAFSLPEMLVVLVLIGFWQQPLVTDGGNSMDFNT